MLGLGMFVVASSPSVPLSITGLFFAGTGFSFVMTTLSASVYARTPEEYRGRVFAFWGVGFLGSRPVAGIVDGALADLIHPRFAVAFAGSVGLLAAVVLRSRWPSTDDHLGVC